ncbi:MAG: 8-oxo-dGTP diphosphatase / 2-hydroxy-dATP diphosphatase [Parcubacteria bacterium C7867-005]|nr:MAG: 8-oxo-dGTP diphosphatase / 2-hydroxy-dATP diphosphatase [Parcubacteria bacterium C7867-005]
MRDATLVFLIKRNEAQRIEDICLAMKKRGFGVNRWNGVGGKVTEGESIEEAAKREADEEIGVTLDKISKVAKLEFIFPHNSSWDQVVHVYFAEEWSGEPTESEEMRPEWFKVGAIPFSEMWPDDIFWLPKTLEGKLLEARFKFGEGDVVLGQEIKII